MASGGRRVIVTGARGALGRHVADRLQAAQSIDEVIGLDRTAGEHVHRIDLLTEDIDTLLTAQDTIVHLAASSTGAAGEADAAASDRELAERILNAAKEAQVRHVVLVSTAMVYGAWLENPMPLTESAEVRPNPEFRYGVVRGEIEALGEAWAVETDSILTILRPATTLARGRQNGLALMLRNSAAFRNVDGEAPLQFLHAEDFAGAVETVVVGKHAGVFNVAPDGWLRPSEVSALRGRPDTPVRAPAVVNTAIADARRRFGAATHPGLTPYLQHPWVVANDKLKALGWKPDFSNEEAYVSGHSPSRLDGLTAKRRQELALGAAGAILSAGVIGTAAITSWVIRRRR